MNWQPAGKGRIAATCPASGRRYMILSSSPDNHTAYNKKMHEKIKIGSHDTLDGAKKLVDYHRFGGHQVMDALSDPPSRIK